MIYAQMLFDTHAHIYLDRFDADRDDVIKRAREAGVKTIAMPAIDVPSMDLIVDLCARHDGLYGMAGLHPTETKDAGDADFDSVRAFAKEDKVVAIGETGLDYYWDDSYKEKQQEFLRRHIRLAAEMDLPLVFHNRDSSEDLVRVVREEQEAAEDARRIRGIFHCFSGPKWLADEIMDLGFHVGLGGTLTFKNGGVPETITDIPLERIVIETDAPFLAPVPKRGKTNEPAFTAHTAACLAEVRGMARSHLPGPEEEGAP